MIRAEKFYWAVTGYNSRLYHWTIHWQRKGAIAAAVENLPTRYDDRAWKQCRKLGMRVVKIQISEYAP